MVVSAGHPPRDPGDHHPLSFIHREILQLGVLILAAVAAFLLTRAVAASNRDMSLRDAVEWYRRGQQAVGTGRVDDAIDAFRRATVRDRDDRRYVLALAQALALKRDDEGARSVLLTLREAAPEDPDINLQLARLAAASSNATEALRFYRNALYAPWPTEQVAARRSLRVELIRFLLAQGRTGPALSELLALSTDLPDDAATRFEVAQLFAQAGDNRHALEQFQRTLELAPQTRGALAGAGQAAFQLGDYALARTYLRQAPDEPNEVRTTRDVVDLVLSSDPLAVHLGSAERRRRLMADFSYAQERLRTCLEEHAERAGGDSTSEESALESEAQAFEDQWQRSAILEQDTVETGADLIDRIERQVTGRCGVPTAFDRALLLIGRQHGEAR